MQTADVRFWKSGHMCRVLEELESKIKVADVVLGSFGGLGTLATKSKQQTFFLGSLAKDSKQQTLLKGLMAKSKWQTLFGRPWDSQLHPNSRRCFGESGQRTEAADSA